MTLTERLAAQISDREAEARIDAFRRAADDRKREVYWTGFLEGALASDRIEEGEEAALLAEADRFREFFEDPDADDLAEDLRAGCFSCEADMMATIETLVAEKLDALADWTATDELNRFLGFCAGIVCDGRILQREAQAILERFRASEVLMTAAPFARLRRAVEGAIADGVLDEAEAEELREWIAQLVGDGFVDTGIPNIGGVARLDDPITDPAQVRLEAARFVLTGPMKMGPRAWIRAEIERSGGVFQQGMTRCTDYLVVSSTASRHWRTTHFGTKIERGRQLIEAGAALRFVSEDALAGAIAARDAGR